MIGNLLHFPVCSDFILNSNYLRNSTEHKQKDKLRREERVLLSKNEKSLLRKSKQKIIRKQSKWNKNIQIDTLF